MEKDLYSVIGTYGPDWTTGVLAEHVHLVSNICYTAEADGLAYVYDPTGKCEGTYPVLCGEIVEIWTEDGPISGRCGLPVFASASACTAHDEQINSVFGQEDL